MKRLVSFLLIACAGFVVIPNLTAAQDGMKPTVSAKLRERRIAYRDALLKVINLVHRMHQEGQLSIDRLINAQTELGNAESAVTSEPEKCIQKLEANLDPLKKLEAFQKEGAYSNWFGTTGRASRKHGRAYSRGDHAS